MIAATIDIGTNTTLALLAEYTDKGLTSIKDQLTPNRLGEALKLNRTISPEIIALNVDLLNEIVRDYRRYDCEEFAVCGTSALRMALNRLEFVSEVQQIIGLNVEIISGQDEAALTFGGATSGLEIFPHEKICVMDLGGGSTEIVQGQGHTPGPSFSLDMGSVYLTHEFFEDDPPSPEQISALRGRVQQKVIALLGSSSMGDLPWILVGGTAVSLAIFKKKLRVYNPTAISGTVLTRDDIDGLIGSMIGKSSQELQNWPGMPFGRGKYIFAGSLLLRELYDLLHIKEATVSERGLRHGLWLAKFGSKEKR